MLRPALRIAGWLALASAAALAAQDPPDHVSGGSLRQQHREAGALGADGLPRPGFWRLDPEAPARDWLGKPPLDPADLVARPEAYAEVLASHGLLLDLPGRSVSLRGTMLHDETTLEYPIEYLVVTEMGSVHEAAVLVRAQPSVINACLQALQLEPGRATLTRRKDPAPPPAAVEAGEVSELEVVPAHGPLVGIRVAWLDDAGRAHDEPLEELLLDVRDMQPLERRGWIYTGSRMAEYRQGRGHVRWYQADVEGDVIAIYLAAADVCVLERHSLEGLDDTFYTLNTARTPRQGTPVTLVLSPLDEQVPPRPAVDLLELLPPP